MVPGSHLGTLKRLLETSGRSFWRPLGVVLETLGASLGCPGGILGALPRKMPPRIPRRGPRSSPRWAQRAQEGRQKRPKRFLRRPKRPSKRPQNHIRAKNKENFENSKHCSMKTNDFYIPKPPKFNPNRFKMKTK